MVLQAGTSAVWVAILSCLKLLPLPLLSPTLSLARHSPAQVPQILLRLPLWWNTMCSEERFPYRTTRSPLVFSKVVSCRDVR